MHILIEKPTNICLIGTRDYKDMEFVIGQVVDKQKYQLMWHLRSIEADIDKEGGTIIYRRTGNFDLTGFSPALSQRILALIAEGIKQGHWG